MTNMDQGVVCLVDRQVQRGHQALVEEVGVCSLLKKTQQALLLIPLHRPVERGVPLIIAAVELCTHAIATGTYGHAEPQSHTLERALERKLERTLGH